ncbi:hypothetical protein ACP70R_038829 [Stipagrostis hirtigluma subsp. patula]
MSSSHEKTPGLDLPCLAFHDFDRSTALLSFSEHKPIVAGEDTDEVLRNKIICPTAHGLLLVRDPDTTATYLWNPMNCDKIQLPPLGLREVEDTVLIDCHCVLSDKPTAPGCVVLLVEASENTFIWYCHPGDDRWAKYDYDIGSHVLYYPDEEDQYEKRVICPIAACRGTFYFNSMATELGVIDFTGSAAEPAFSTIVIDDGSNVCGHGSIFLVESHGELYMVGLLIPTPGEEIDKARVHMMDFSERRWRDVNDLGGRTFLLSRYFFGASCSGDSNRGLRPDCIYFVCHRTNSLHVFDVQKGTHELHKLDEAPTTDKAFWLLPTDP